MKTTTTTMMTKLDGEDHQKKTQKNAVEPFPRSQVESVLKVELLTLTEHLQRNPSNEKGQGRPLPARGTY